MPIIDIMCSICTEVFKNNDDVHSTSCGHLFHFSCLNDWQTRQSNCPQCRLDRPTSHKVHLSFDESVGRTDESDARSEKCLDIQLKLQTSNEKVAELAEQINEADRTFLQLQEQFTLAHKSQIELKKKFGQMKNFEDDFLLLQGHYTNSSELAKDLEDRINQLLILNECKSEELRRKKLENESLNATLEVRHTALSDGFLNEKLKILDLKLKHMSKEFEIEISKSTQLSIEKIRLQNCVSILENPLQKARKTGPTQNDEKTKNSAKTRKKVDVTKERFENNKSQDEETSNVVFIKQFPLNQINKPLENVILSMASIMEVSLSSDDLIKVNLVDSSNKNSTKVQLLAQFKSSQIKDNFVSGNKILRKCPGFKDIGIDDVHELFMYAKNKLLNIGFHRVFYKNNKIFAQEKLDAQYVHIQSKGQVDKIQIRNEARTIKTVSKKL